MENGDVLMTDQIKERWYMVLDPTTYTSRRVLPDLSLSQQPMSMRP